MSKTNKIYKIFMTTMIVAIAGMLLAMGIIAAQKTMKLGVQFSSNPNYKLEVFINDEETLIFRNFADNETGKTVKMDNGITSLNGDTLVADNNVFKNYGNDFTIIIKNYTESTGIEVAMESTAKIDGGADGIPAQIEAIDNTASKYDPNTQIADSVSFRIYINSVFPQTTTLKMTISELASYNVSFSAGNTSTGNINTTIDYGSPYSQTLTAQNGYIFDNNITVTGVEAGGYTWEPNGSTGVFTITDWSKVTGPISITVNAVQGTISVSYNLTNCTANSFTDNPVVGSSYVSQTLIASNGYIFDSNLSVNGVAEGGYSWVVTEDTTTTPHRSTAKFSITNWALIGESISITPTTRYPTLSITYEGVAVDGSAKHGAKVELVLGEPIDGSNHGNNASCGALLLQTYTPEADNTYAIVQAGKSVCLYSGAVSYETEVDPSMPVPPEDLIGHDWVSLSYLESTPTITQEFLLYGSVYLEYDNYFYFYMPASDVVLKIKTA